MPPSSSPLSLSLSPPLTPRTTIHAPLTAATPTDQSGPIAILTAFSLGLILLSICVRLYARRNARKWGYEDVAFYCGVTLSLTQSTLLFYLVSRGLGKSPHLLPPSSLHLISKTQRASMLLYIGTLLCSKASCGFTFLWLTPYAAQKRAAWALIALSGAWGVSSLFVEGLGCRGVKERCGGFVGRWAYISATDAALEVALVGAIAYMVWGRQMARRAKWTVVGAFAWRVPNIAISITRLVFLMVRTTPAIYAARVHGSTQVAVGYTIVACVIPYLGPLMQSYEDDGRKFKGPEEPSFDLSERSRESKGSGFGSGARSAAGAGAGAGNMVESKGKGKMMGMELSDVSKLLGPETASTRVKSGEISAHSVPMPVPVKLKESGRIV